MKYNPQKGNRINNFILLTLALTPPLVGIIPFGLYLAGNFAFAKMRNLMTHNFHSDPNHYNELFLNSVYQNVYSKKYMQSKISSIFAEIEKNYPHYTDEHRINDTKFLIDVYMSLSMQYLGKYVFNLVDKWLSVSPTSQSSMLVKTFARNDDNNSLNNKINKLSPERKEQFLSILSVCERQMQNDGVPTKFIALDHIQIDNEGSFSDALRAMKNYVLTDIDRAYFKAAVTYTINEDVFSKIKNKLKLILTPSKLSPLVLVYNSNVATNHSMREAQSQSLGDTSYLENLLKYNNSEDNDLILGYLDKIQPRLSAKAIEIYSSLKMIRDDKRNLEEAIMAPVNDSAKDNIGHTKTMKAKGQKI